jgi:hypothetical protein
MNTTLSLHTPASEPPQVASTTDVTIAARHEEFAVSVKAFLQKFCGGVAPSSVFGPDKQSFETFSPDSQPSQAKKNGDPVRSRHHLV